MKPIVTLHNKKLLSENINTIPPYYRRVKNKCPLTGKCRIRNILYKCVATTSMKPEKIYLETMNKISNNVLIIIKDLSTTLLIVMTQHAPNTFGTSKKIQQNPRFEMVYCKDSSIIF